MAGFYPDVPGNRFAYDIDGTIVGYIQNLNSPSFIEANLSQRQTLNNESSDTVTMTNATVLYCAVFLFPELRDIDGIYVAATETGNRYMQWSNDTTNGIDGTWSNFASNWTFANTTDNTPEFSRELIMPVSLSGVRGLRVVKTSTNVNSSRRFAAVHIYGSISQSDRLKIWSQDSDEPIDPAYFDMGDIPRGGSSVKGFRIKNVSDTLTATSIDVSAEALTDGGAQTTVQAISFSDDDGESYGSAIQIGELEPGDISGVIYVKYEPTSSASLGAKFARILMEVGSWS